MRYLSVCSGIEAASCAWKPLGWEPVAFSEIEPFPCAVLAHHYPTVPNWGDMTKFKEWPDANFDVLCGGTPCQSFSVAGLREGLGDPRGNLMLTFGAITGRYRPRWLVWENVAGVLSSNKGRDFGTFLGLLGECGYGFAYRLFDAQYFGVAQRRRRVFVVGHLGDWRPAAAVLFERHSLQGHPPPRREAGENPSLCPTLRAGGNRTGGDRPPGTDVDTVESLVTHSLRADGFDASEDGTGRGTPLVPVPHVPISPSLKARDYKGPSGDGDGDGDGAILVPMAMNLRGREGGAMPELDDVASIRASSGGSSRSYIAFDTTQITHPANHSNPKPGDPCHPLAKGAHAPAIAFHGTQDPDVSGDVTHPMGCNYGQEQVALIRMRVRRLTPRECERLQGFPDDYTAIPIGKKRKPAKDGPRYKALGNSWAVPNARWIGERMDMVSALLEAAQPPVRPLAEPPIPSPSHPTPLKGLTP